LQNQRPFVILNSVYALYCLNYASVKAHHENSTKYNRPSDSTGI